LDIGLSTEGRVNSMSASPFPFPNPNLNPPLTFLSFFLKSLSTFGIKNFQYNFLFLRVLSDIDYFTKKKVPSVR
jgi:hypothetical protein